MAGTAYKEDASRGALGSTLGRPPPMVGIDPKEDSAEDSAEGAPAPSTDEAKVRKCLGDLLDDPATFGNRIGTDFGRCVKPCSESNACTGCYALWRKARDVLNEETGVSKKTCSRSLESPLVWERLTVAAGILERGGNVPGRTEASGRRTAPLRSARPDCWSRWTGANDGSDELCKEQVQQATDCLARIAELLLLYKESPVRCVRELIELVWGELKLGSKKTGVDSVDLRKTLTWPDPVNEEPLTIRKAEETWMEGLDLALRAMPLTKGRSPLGPSRGAECLVEEARKEEARLETRLRKARVRGRIRLASGPVSGETSRILTRKLSGAARSRDDGSRKGFEESRPRPAWEELTKLDSVRPDLNGLD